MQEPHTIAIMQPTYLPWIGYLDLIDQVDCFVFLDSVQFNKRSWQQRNKIKGSGGAMWCTIPVITKGRRDQLICDVEVDQSQEFQIKHIKTVQYNYEKAEYADPFLEEFSLILDKRHELLADLNIELINWMCDCFGIRAEFIRSSSLAANGKKTDLLVQICKELDARCYLSALGSKEYIEENNMFHPNDIELRYHSYEHPEYNQLHGTFESHLSALDLLLNKGASGLSVIRSGRGR